MTSVKRVVAGAGIVVAVVAGAVGAVHAARHEPAAPSHAATSPATDFSSSNPSPASARRAPSAVPTRSSGSVPAPKGVAPAVAKSLQPVHIAVPAIGVDASLTHLGIAKNGSIQVPPHPLQAGWLDTGPAPGQRGPAVIAGHVDSTRGPAVFYRLSELKPGDPIVITRRDGSTVRFTVDGLQVYPKNRFPTAATYGPVPGPALRLITCGGAYVPSRGGYLDNVVVFAS